MCISEKTIPKGWSIIPKMAFRDNFWLATWFRRLSKDYEISTLQRKI